jgi:hypothetical protein
MFAWMVKQSECMKTESLIEKSVQFRRDNYNDLTSEQVKSFEQTILEDSDEPSHSY